MTRHFMISAGLCAAIAAVAQPAAAAKSVCIPTYQIDHTEIADNHTILFFMHGHKVYKANLINNCSSLKVSSRGFTYTPTDPGTNEICSNLLTIHVNDTGETCLVGELTPVDLPVSKTSP